MHAVSVKRATGEIGWVPLMSCSAGVQSSLSGSMRSLYILGMQFCKPPQISNPLKHLNLPAHCELVSVAGGCQTSPGRGGGAPARVARPWLFDFAWVQGAALTGGAPPRLVAQFHQAGLG